MRRLARAPESVMSVRKEVSVADVMEMMEKNEVGSYHNKAPKELKP